MLRNRALRLLLILLACLGLVAAGCGGGDDESTDGDTASEEASEPTDEGATEESADEAEDEAGGEVVTTLDATIWFGGFQVTFGDVTAPAEGEEGTVTIAAEFENLAETEWTFDGTAVLESAGESSESTALETDIPLVPGGGTADGLFAFPVEDTFDLEDAVLTIGRPGITQAIVPLNGDEPVTLEPAEVAVTGGVTAGGLALTANGAELRADVVDDFEQAEDGRLFLTIDFDVTYTPPPNYTGGYAFAYQGNLALVLPDGTQTAALEGPIELIDGNATLQDQQVRFEVHNPPAGDYQLLLVDDSGAEDVQSALAFTIADDVVIGEPSADEDE